MGVEVPSGPMSWASAVASWQPQWMTRLMAHALHLGVRARTMFALSSAVV